ncbi:MAG TPA: metal-sulfur cluster assembly factor [Chloroflexota bacterium]|nr:metal-sulfur cluster assembly factor [Chloroflexota bacterium]
MSTLHSVVTAEDVVRELSQVYDPEIGIDIVNLGLVYEVVVNDDASVEVRMTLTTPGCPVGPYIQAEVHRALENLPLIQDVEISLVWDPPWSWEMMSPEAKKELGIGE